MKIARRSVFVGASAVLGAVALDACGAPAAPNAGPSADVSSAVPLKPSKPVTLNILDVAGDLQLTQGMIDDFKANNPDIVSSVTTSSASAPELVGKIKAQQNAGRVDIAMVLTGTDGLAGGLSQKIWQPLLPTNASVLTGMDNYLAPATKMQTLAGDYGVCVTYYPSGPLIEYVPTRVSTPPTSADELLAWAKAHPNKFEYAQPANSGPGRTWLMGLPYILGDTDPMDPTKGWDKTWAYLTELGSYISVYPSGTTQTMKDLASGSVDMIMSTTGWDINPRALGTVPIEAKIGTLKNFKWVTDAHYVVVPNGVSQDQLTAVVRLIAWMLKPDQQAKAYDKGYFYPGPAIKDVTLAMAPQASQDVIAKYGRPEYDSLIANNPTVVPLPYEAMVAAFDLWNRNIAGSKAAK
jgi:putative spermidine/putrescine transport system substrate-binding protein